jgi:hypothetical protein
VLQQKVKSLFPNRGTIPVFFEVCGEKIQDTAKCRKDIAKRYGFTFLGRKREGWGEFGLKIVAAIWLIVASRKPSKQAFENMIAHQF